MTEAGRVTLLRIVVSTGLAACSFTPPEVTSDDVPTPDAAAAGDVDASATTIVPCATPDASGLVLCLELEDGVEDGVLSDSSPAGRHAVTSGLVAETRNVPAMSGAARVMPDATARVPEDPGLDLAAGYTIAVWIRPARQPDPGEVFGIIDREQQYAMLTAISSVTGGLENRCVHTGVARYEYTEALPAETWSFLACTWDGTTLCAYRWTSTASHERYCHAPTFLPSTTGAEGLAIGHLSQAGAAHSRIDGALDSLQIYRRGMTEAQLCALAGQPAGCML
jgi:hypothetical protein